MKTIRVTSNFQILTASVAIAVITTCFRPVSADVSAPEIGWSSRISSMGLDEIDNIGENYTFYCQPASEDLIHAPIWGTKTYTVNSGICSTAAHSGMIVPEEGGEVTVKLIEGKNFYTGSRKNSIVSKDHRGTPLSFTFVGKKKVKIGQINSQTPKKKREASGIEKIIMDGFQRGVERSIERAITDMLD